jgi:MFS family permease
MPAADRMSAREIRASAALASIFGLRMLGLFLILPVFAVHARALPGGDNAAAVGVALGVYGLTQACLQIPFGIASDRYGRKPVIVAGLLLFALGSVIAALAHDIAWIIVGRAVQGAGAVSAAVTAFIADTTREEHRTKAMAMVGATIGLTFALSLIGAPPLYAAIGMSGLFYLTAALSVLAIGVVLWVVPAAPPRIVHEDAAHWRDVVFDPQLLRLNFGIFALHAVQVAMFVVVPVLLVERGLPLARHAWVYLPVVLASFALMMPPILAAERRGRMRALFLGAIGLLAAVQLGLLWLAPSVPLLAFWLLLFFVAFNILEASLPSLVSRLAPAAHKGLALGVYNTTQAVGLFVGGAAGGWLARHFGAGAVFACAAATMAAWAIVANGMREPPARRRGAPIELTA